MPRITTWVPRGPGIKWSKEQKRRLAERGRKPIPTIKLKGPIPTLKLEGSRKPKPQAVIRENRVYVPKPPVIEIKPLGGRKPIPTLKLEGSRKPKPQAVIRENRVK